MSGRAGGRQGRGPGWDFLDPAGETLGPFSRRSFSVKDGPGGWDPAKGSRSFGGLGLPAESGVAGAQVGEGALSGTRRHSRRRRSPNSEKSTILRGAGGLRGPNQSGTGTGAERDQPGVAVSGPHRGGGASVERANRVLREIKIRGGDRSRRTEKAPRGGEETEWEGVRAWGGEAPGGESLRRLGPVRTLSSGAGTGSWSLSMSVSFSD